MNKTGKKGVIILVVSILAFLFGSTTYPWSHDALVLYLPLLTGLGLLGFFVGIALTLYGWYKGEEKTKKSARE